MTRTCLHCGQEFEPRRADERLCSFECRRLRQVAHVKACISRKSERLRAARRLEARKSAQAAAPVDDEDGR